MSSLVSRVFNPLNAFAFAMLLLGAGLAAQSRGASVYEFSTLGGSIAASGNADGVGTAARFNAPASVAVDRSGNVFVADTQNFAVRKIAPDGTVTTFAAYIDPAAQTRFVVPKSVAVDRAGNVYVMDYGAVRKVTPAGVVTTLAGSSSASGSADGTGSAARFGYYATLTCDDGGTVYVADTANSTIRKVTPDGVVTTIAGSAGRRFALDGTGANAGFLDPTGIVADAAGNLYVTDSPYADTIRKITPAGVVTTFAGLDGHSGKADGVGGAARFLAPSGIAIDRAGTLYVIDGRGCIRRVTPDGAVTFFAGSVDEIGYLNGPATAARFNSPTGLAVDAAGNVYVADQANHAIRQVQPGGGVTTLAGAIDGSGSADGFAASRLSAPVGIARDPGGVIYVADKNNHTIRRIATVLTKGGATYSTATFAGAPNQPGSIDGVTSAARFNAPVGVATDRAGDVFVSEIGNHTIRKITPAGAVTTFAGAAGQSGNADGAGLAARFNRPMGLAVDAADNLYVADSGNHTVRKITPDGAVTTFAGAAGVPGTTDGPLAGARFDTPLGFAVDPAGNLYVAQGGSATGLAPARNVRKIAPDGNVGTLDVTGNALATDVAGNLFVLSDNALLRRTPAGAVRVVGGAPGQIGSMDGTGTLARFRHPQGIIVVPNNHLFIADTDNNTIRLGGFYTAGWMANISTRSLVGTGDNVQIAGFVIPGPDPRPVLIRAAGPALAAAPFKITNALGDPVLQLFQGQTVIASNTAWSSAANAVQVKSTAVDVGAFAWADGSKDSALLVTLAPGAYTAVVSSQSGASGTALVEVYDASAYFSRRLINISGRTLVGTGDNVQIAGFVVGGPEAKEVLIRVSGPTLASAFSIPGAIADPVLELFDSSGERIGRNAGWNGDAEIRAAGNRVGAFAWPDGSKDAALHVTLRPGLYTVHASSAAGATGTALIEVYDDDPQFP